MVKGNKGAAMAQFDAGGFEIRIEGLTDGWEGSLAKEQPEDGLAFFRLKLTSQQPQRPPKVKLAWEAPIVDIHARWHPQAGFSRNLPPDFAGPAQARGNSSAPVMSLYDLNGRNRLTYAFSDAMNAVLMMANVHEETADLKCWIQLFNEPCPPMTEYEAVLRIDTRDVHFSRAIGDVSAWWAAQEGYDPSPVPEPARLPLYSSWYSFHQKVDAAEVEKQCGLAKELGCEAVIMDDGWQTTDTSRGYEHCGDWEPLRIPDIKEHVARVHDIGMKYVLWYAVPFVGVQNPKTWGKFKDKFLTADRKGFGIGTLDPRFPDVREHLIGVFERAMIDWDLDGLKLDFVDSFRLPPEMQDVLGGGRDYDSVPEAVDRLLSDVIDRLRKIKPDVMIEFRQGYIGPLMRRYGNMFRAGDCPNDSLSNRVRTMDIRLLCGNTACHSDMLMWHPDEPVESAAMQIVNILFSVPQISVLLDKLPPEHHEMTRFWLAFWRDNRDVLLDGELLPQSPELLYPAITATSAGKRVIAVYGDTVGQVGDRVPPELYVINGTLKDRVVIEAGEDLGFRFMEVRDCRGRAVQSAPTQLSAGVHAIHIPPAGVARLART